MTHTFNFRRGNFFKLFYKWYCLVSFFFLYSTLIDFSNKNDVRRHFSGVEYQTSFMYALSIVCMYNSDYCANSIWLDAMLKHSNKI